MRYHFTVKRAFKAYREAVKCAAVLRRLELLELNGKENFTPQQLDLFFVDEEAKLAAEDCDVALAKEGGLHDFIYPNSTLS